MPGRQRRRGSVRTSHADDCSRLEPNVIRASVLPERHPALFDEANKTDYSEPFDSVICVLPSICRLKEHESSLSTGAGGECVYVRGKMIQYRRSDLNEQHVTPPAEESPADDATDTGNAGEDSPLVRSLGNLGSPEELFS